MASARSKNLFKVAWWVASGQLARAKRLLADMVDGDLSAMNAIGITVHNVIKSLRAMRVLYADEGARSQLTAQMVAERRLFAPASLYRQARADGHLGNVPLFKNY